MDSPTSYLSGSWWLQVIAVPWLLLCMVIVHLRVLMYFRGRSPRKYIKTRGCTTPYTKEAMVQLACIMIGLAQPTEAKVQLPGSVLLWFGGWIAE